MKAFTVCDVKKFHERFLGILEFADKRKQFVEVCESRYTVETPPANTDWMKYILHIESEYGASGMQVITATAMNQNPPKDKVLSLIELERKMFLEKESKTRFMIHMILTTFSAAVAFAAFGWQFIS